MPQHTLQLGLILAMLVGLTAGAWTTPRLIRSFEFRRKLNLALAALFFGCVVLLLYSNGRAKRTYGAGLFLLVAVGCAMAEATRRKSEKACRQNYLHDPSHCGRCGHDPASEDRCPHCGWTIPKPDAPIERRDWAMFWQSGWRINHLDNWHKTLALTVSCMLGFAAVTAWSIYLASPFFMVLSGLMTLYFGISTLRVVQYATDAQNKTQQSGLR